MQILSAKPPNPKVLGFIAKIQEQGQWPKTFVREQIALQLQQQCRNEQQLATRLSWAKAPTTEHY